MFKFEGTWWTTRTNISNGSEEDENFGGKCEELARRGVPDLSSETNVVFMKARVRPVAVAKTPTQRWIHPHVKSLEGVN